MDTSEIDGLNNTGAKKLKLIDLELKNLDDDELELSEQLKLLCDKNGREIDPKKSAQILHKLGKVYRSRTPDLFSLIRSAALFNAAIVRSPRNSRRIKMDLRLLCKHVLTIAGAANKNADLIQQAAKMKKDVLHLRKFLRKELKNIIPIPEHTEDDKINSLELDRTAKVQRLQEKVASNYTEIMANIAENCEAVLGPSPCEYALAGMGSLARKEITPYSDFEHIILLENEVKDYENYEDCLTYFRWFSVIFQIIIINLGETIIPCVAISTLNDKTGPLGDWFYDVCTVRGVSFDFMLPHASHFPLGRRQLTEKKPWITELIRPIDEMLKYLSSEESLKNGYHLEDILVKTCFVCKSKKVFNEFQQKVFHFLETEGQNSQGIESVKNQLIDDLENFSARPALAKLRPSQSFDVKKVFYRSITLFVMSLGRICNVGSLSCFEILEELAKKDQISETAKIKLMYAVALACEVRLKWYSLKDSQRDDIPSIGHLLQFIGISGVKAYFQIAYALQCDVSKRLKLKKAHFYSDLNLLNLNIGYCLEDHHLQRISGEKTIESSSSERLYNFDECFQLLTKNTKNLRFCVASNYNKNDKFESSFALALQYQKVGRFCESINSFDDAVACYERSTDMFSKLQSNVSKQSQKNESSISVKDLNELLAYNNMRIGVSNLDMNKPNKAIDYLKLSLRSFEQLSPDISQDFAVATTLHYIGICYNQILKPEDAKSYLEKSLEIEKRMSSDIDTDQRVASTLHEIGCCLIGMNELEDARGHLEKSVEIQEQITESVSDISTDAEVAVTLRDLGRCLMKMNKLEEAKCYLNRSLEMFEQTALHSGVDRGVPVTLFEIGRCLMKMDQLEEALDHLNRSLKLWEQLTLDVRKDFSVAETLFEIGLCLLQMNETEEAKIHLEKSLKIQKQSALEVSADSDIAVTLHEIGRCLRQMKEFEEAKQYLDKSLELQKQLAVYTNADQGIATTLLEIGRCLLEMNELEEARSYLCESLEIEERLKLDVSRNHAVAGTLYEIGRCLLQMDDYEESMSHLKRSFRIYEQTLVDMNTNGDVAAVLHEIGCCLMQMNHLEEAKKHLDRSLEIRERLPLDVKVDSEIAGTLYEIGRCLVEMDKIEEAKQYFDRSLTIGEQTTVDINTDSDIAGNLYEIGCCLLKMNRFNEAKIYLDRSLEIEKQVSSDIRTDYDVGLTFFKIGCCLMQMNDLEEAKKYLDQSLEIQELIATDANTDNDIAETRSAIARCLMQMNKPEGAESCFN